jgi:uncharacterized damage-inducible protein DinB
VLWPLPGTSTGLFIFVDHLGSVGLSLMLKEFNEEAAVTKRVLDGVPDDNLRWRSHPKMALRQLAIHIATVPGGLANITKQDSFDASQGSFTPPQPHHLQAIHAALEQSILSVREALEAATEETGNQMWR